MSFQNNNITIIPTTGYNSNFSWQVGFASAYISGQNLQFRATIRPLHGLESYTRIPNQTILFQQTGIVINSVTRQGNWSFPLTTNATISGGPYRDYQVVIEAHDTNGYTSAGNYIVQGVENGWTMYNQGYDILAIKNPRQTGIELGNNLPTQYSMATGSGITTTGFTLHSGHGYSTLNYMGTHGEINVRYLSGNFNSNIVGGFIYAWTGQFPKRETALRVSGYDQVTKSQFSFNPSLGYVYHPTAAMAFRGANSIYTSLSFYDSLDQAALNNGIDISTGLYLSDNAICYNDIAAGSISLGGFSTIYALQFTGNGSPTGIVGTGVSILYSGQFNNNTSIIYISRPVNVTGINTSYQGTNKTQAGGLGGNSILINNMNINTFVNGKFTARWSTDASTWQDFPINISSSPNWYIQITADNGINISAVKSWESFRGGYLINGTIAGQIFTSSSNGSISGPVNGAYDVNLMSDTVVNGGGTVLYSCGDLFTISV